MKKKPKCEMRKPKWVINTKENFWYDYDYFELEIPILQYDFLNLNLILNF